MKPLLCTLICLLLISCGLHIPQSEGLVYESEEERLNKETYFRPYETSVAVSRAYFSNDFITQARIANDSTYKDFLSPLWLTYFEIASGAILIGDKAVAGFSPGFLLFGPGLDVTVNVFGPTYATITGDLLQNGELILQCRTYQNITSTISLGGYYRKERQVLGKGLLFTMLGDITPIYLDIQSVGFRLGYQYRKGEYRYRVFLSVGKELDFDTITINSGLSIS